MNDKKFVHLHVHSEYSLLDGACRINKLIDKTLEQNIKSVAITDHGCMFGVIEFYKQALQKGVKPIIGCEVYVANRSRYDKTFEYDSKPYHMVLLCENNIGYQNLIKIVSLGYTEGFYKKPRVDDEILEKYSEGLIALSACIAGKIPRLLLSDEYDEAKKVALNYSKIFGKDNFYLEIQNHGLENQLRVLPKLVKLSEETGIPLVATNDCHYIEKEDNKMHKVLLCIQTNHTLNDENGFEFGSKEFYLKNEDEMYNLFKQYPKSLENTVKIADRCNVILEFGNTKLPHFELQNNKDHFEYIKEQSYKGLYEKYGENPSKNLIERLNYELDIINTMGYVDYFLIVHDFVQYARNHNIAVGPGRGSGAGSLVAYLIGITGIDPIKYNLIFERFLNPERVSMPDFDIDFCYENRFKVIDYVISKYKKDHVAQIITFGTMAARGAIRDVGRVMGLSYAQVDKIAKLIPTELNITIEKALKVSNELKEKYENMSQIRELIDTAKKIEGMPRQASTHAAGVVITKEPVDYYVPLAKNGDAIVTQYTMTRLEELGLLKMDFLGLRTLTVLKYAENMIKSKDNAFDISKIPQDDKEVFQMLSKGETVGVFQFESSGMKNLLMKLEPEHLEDLIAAISLYRPGPMDSIPKYIENRHNPEMVTYLHPKLSKILDVTYGCIVYQEQVMQIFRELAGYSLGRADIVRRAMSKKKHDVMAKEKDIFINGCMKNNINRTTAEVIFDQMASFASYAFNKSHAAAYAFVSYQTAYLKCYYPKEFMAALLTSVYDDSTKVTTYIEECHNLGIEVISPSVNESDKNFTVVGDNIRFALIAVRNLGEGFIDLLLNERNMQGKFTSFYSFCKRMHKNGLSKRTMEYLVKSGSLDNLGANRNQMLQSYASVLSGLAEEDKKNVEGQLDMFDMPENSDDVGFVLPAINELPEEILLKAEKESTGIYFSGHPLSKYKKIIDSGAITQTGDILEKNSNLKNGDSVTMLCIIDKVVKKTTKSNRTIAFLLIEDMQGTMEVVLFSDVFDQFSYLLNEMQVIKLTGRLSIQSDEKAKIICESISKKLDIEIKKCNNSNSRNSVKSGLYIRLPHKKSYEEKKALLYIDIFIGGNTPVYFYYEDSQKLMKISDRCNVVIDKIWVDDLKKYIGEDNVKICD